MPPEAIATAVAQCATASESESQTGVSTGPTRRSTWKVSRLMNSVERPLGEWVVRCTGKVRSLMNQSTGDSFDPLPQAEFPKPNIPSIYNAEGRWRLVCRILLPGFSVAFQFSLRPRVCRRFRQVYHHFV